MITYTVKVSDAGDKYWYLNGKIHREDGPAVEFVNGTKHWYLDGKQFSESEWKQQVKKLKYSCVDKIIARPSASAACCCSGAARSIIASLRSWASRPMGD